MMAEHQVTITGGSSVLGQHLIKQIQKQASHITRICLLEHQCYRQGFVEVVAGSVTSYDDILFATHNSQTVLHLATTRDRRMFVDMEPCEAVNVTGTMNVIKACKRNGVKNLIFVSSIDVLIGYKDIINGTDRHTTYPKKHLFPDSVTRCIAEKAVLAANEYNILHTLVIRPVTMYGELDNRYLASMLRLALANYGELLCVGDFSCKTQLAYLGNVAHAIICAERTLREDPALCAGKSYIITDDTPADNPFDIIKPLLRRYGFFVTTWSVPEKYAKAMMVVLKVILWLLSPFIAYNPHFSYELVHYLCHTYTFSDKRARRELGYQPIYPTANSWQRTFAYFDEKFKVALVDFLSKNVIGQTGHTATMLQLNTLKKNISVKQIDPTRYRWAWQVACLKLF
ncbi:hypothetical protein BaRGS_00039463 [Batillaria attramentaria]|uniref:3-beta hydroxysteroid dehydrogenase/isomerase domain-containing protein n=1 Tax=Batillaria attramentaria TaxID=370345 RepID=A0ABD0J333_9CAEN